MSIQKSIVIISFIFRVKNIFVFLLRSANPAPASEPERFLAGEVLAIEKVEDVMKIMEYGVMSTPGLVIDGKVVSTGKLLGVDEIKKIIQSS